jgi:RNA polymerase sigma-70 factor, ECF subfamily
MLSIDSQVRDLDFSRTDVAEPGEDAVREAVARAKSGDPAAVRFLYMRYAAEVEAYVRSIVRDSHEAEDIAHNVFAKLVPSLARYEERSVPFAAWIMRVARNAALDSIRQRRAIPYEDVRKVDTRQVEGIFSAVSESLRHALSELPEEQRRVLLMRHMLGMTPGEIAEQLGKSEGSIHALHHRGRGALRAALVRLGAAPATCRPRATSS